MYHPTQSLTSPPNMGCGSPSLAARLPPGKRGFSRELQVPPKPGDLTEPQLKWGGWSRSHALHFGNCSPQKPHSRVGASDLLSLHTTSPCVLCEGSAGDYACPLKGAGRGSEDQGKVSDAHAHRVGPPHPPPPNTFYINSTHKAYSPYLSPHHVHVAASPEAELFLPFSSPPPTTEIRICFKMSFFWVKVVG